MKKKLQQNQIKRNTIVSTHNCNESVLVERGEQKPTYKKINDIDELNNVNAIKKNDENPRPTNDNSEDYLPHLRSKIQDLSEK